MSQELLYTSAPHGLKPGSRGFCTVLSTQGMAAPLASALEGLSGYRPVFPPGDEQHRLNPVNWSHVTLQVAGRTWHILSRIAEYGLDYSQRTNKLAHHVVLDTDELITAGPAALLVTPGFMRSEWNEEPRLAPPKPVQKIPPLPRGVCQAWKELTGDGGWAGVLAESFLRDPDRPVILLYAPGQDMLPLMAEALSLIPAARRWEVTFSTYFTGLAQGVNCTWRCLLRDSSEAHQSLRFVRALRLDLTIPEALGFPAGNELVADARGLPRLKSGSSDKPPPLPTDLLDETPGAQLDPVDVHDEYSGEIPPLPGPLKSARRQPKPFFSKRTLGNQPSPGNDLEEPARRRTRTILGVGFALLLLLLIAVGVSFGLQAHLHRSPAQHQAQPALPPAAKPRPVEDRKTAPPELKPIPNPTPVVAKKKVIVPVSPATATKEVDNTPTGKPPQTDPNVPPSSANSKQPIQASETKDGLQGQQGRHEVKWDDKGHVDFTILASITPKEKPSSEPVLWSPPEMKLILQRSSELNSVYDLRQENSLAPFGNIFWDASSQKNKMTGAQSFDLKLKGKDAAGLFAKLRWCEIDVTLDDSNKSIRTVCFHPFPCERKDVKTPINLKTGPKPPREEVKWTLPIEIGSSHLPRFSSNGITLATDGKEFDFVQSEQSTKIKGLHVLKLTNQHIKEDADKLLPSKGGMKPGDGIFLQLVTSIYPEGDDSNSRVVITVTLEGWPQVTQAIQNQRKTKEQKLLQYREELAKLLKDLSQLRIKSAELHYEVQNAATGKSREISIFK